MKYLVLLLSLLLSSVAFGEGFFLEGGQVHIGAGNTKFPMVIFVNSYAGLGPLAGEWTTIDLTPHGVPVDAKAVFLSGLLLITHGTLAETCDLHITMRTPGDNLPAAAHMGQVIETGIGSGQRSPISSWVPVIDGKLEFHWYRGTQGEWPSHCSYGINLSLQAYVD